VFQGAPRWPIFVAALTIFGAGCSSGSAADGCPATYPMTCPSPAPSFAADVAPLIQEHCTSCHGPGQQLPTLGTYENIASPTNQQHVFFRLQYCTMPPPPRTPLTAQERDTILGWIVCGGLNN